MHFYTYYGNDKHENQVYNEYTVKSLQNIHNRCEISLSKCLLDRDLFRLFKVNEFCTHFVPKKGLSNYFYMEGLRMKHRISTKAMGFLLALLMCISMIVPTTETPVSAA